MSPTQFTPGPWTIDPATRPAEVCTLHGLPEELTEGQGWAHVRGEIGYWGADEHEQMANAHLIAAAPELYAALHAMCSHWDSLLNNMDSGDEFNARIAAGAALAKAREGES